MKRIESLRYEKKWPFRQIKKHVAPAREKVHWDFLLEEMVSC